MESFTIAVNYYLHSTPPQTFMSVLGTPVKSLTGEWGKFNGNVYKKVFTRYRFHQFTFAHFLYTYLFVYIFIYVNVYFIVY